MVNLKPTIGVIRLRHILLDLLNLGRKFNMNEPPSVNFIEMRVGSYEAVLTCNFGIFTSIFSNQIMNPAS